ncbi:hypothetical protein ACFLYQ_04085 [Chloroflexota bacterium]
MSNNLSKKLTPFLVTLFLIITAGMLSCYAEEEYSTAEPGFGIYLVDTGELVLSEQHIKAYHRNVHLTVDEEEDTHAIELNKAGIEQWNSFLNYEGIPQLKDTLFNRDFSFRIEEKEKYRGKFYSMVSSASYDGVVILDALFKLDKERNRIYISFGYPGSDFTSSKDPRNNPEIIDYFNKQGLLK